MFEEHYQLGFEEGVKEAVNVMDPVKFLWKPVKSMFSSGGGGSTTTKFVPNKSKYEAAMKKRYIALDKQNRAAQIAKQKGLPQAKKMAPATVKYGG